MIRNKKLIDEYRIVVYEDSDSHEYEYWWPVHYKFCWLPTDVREGKRVWLKDAVRIYVQTCRGGTAQSGWMYISVEDLTMMELKYATRA